MSGDPSRSRVRIVHAMIAIRSARTTGHAITDDAVAQRHGYRDAAELVGAMLEETMPASRAVMLIETFHLRPWPQESGVLSIRFRVEAELRKAIDAGEPWIRPKRTINGPIAKVFDEYLVEAPQMLEWFLAATVRRQFVAPVLRTALAESASPVIEPDASTIAEGAPVSVSPPNGTEAIRITYRSGLPGKPTSIQLVENEMVRRIRAGEVLNSMSREAKALAAWLKEKHPLAPRCGVKTIQNRLGDLYKKTIPK